MRKLYIVISIILGLLISPLLNAQVETFTFEQELPLADTFINGEDGTSSLFLDPIEFPIVYDFTNGFWAGQWAVSTVRDSITPNFTNLYGSRPGEGANGSDVFLVGQAPFGGDRLQFNSTVPITLQSAQLTNTTYAYYVIRDGNQFSKAFGGTSGDDPDYFFLRWTGYLQGQVTDSLDIYLADYRFSDNSQDYILKDWTMFDLEALGTVDRVEIEFYSSDEGQFGINTPLFFNLDDLTFMRSSQTNLIQGDYAFQIYPNPTQEYLRWSTDLEIEYFQLYSSAGHLLGQQKKPSENEIHVGRLPSGLYYLLAKTSEGIIRRSFIKH